MLRSSSLRHALGILKQHQRCTSSVPTAALTTDKIHEEVLSDNQNKPKEDAPKETVTKDEIPSARSNLVKTAFANLKHNQRPLKSNIFIEDKISHATSPEELLQLSDKTILTKGQAVKIVSTLSEWSLNGRIKDSNFESDPRFVALCRLIGKNSRNSSQVSLRNGDLSVVLGVTGEDEAAKIIETLSLPQMIKVLTSLSYKKRRSLPLLRSLAFNIGRIPSKLDVKQSADILYAISTLNFPDEVLVEKVWGDLVETIPTCQKSSVFASICTSVGLLRYKDTEFLHVLCNWAMKQKDICRSQDLVSLLLCLASVRHVPNEELLAVLSHVTEGEMPSASVWLDVVWSLAILGAASEAQLSSVLNPKFVDKLTSSAAGFSWKKKLLNLNGAAKWTKGYKGSLLNESLDLELSKTRSKEKQLLVTSVVDTLSNLFPSSNHFRSCVDSGMGFLIDAECIIDAKMNPSLLIDKKTGQPIEDKSGMKNRIAIFVHDYHDCTRGRIELAGSSYFNTHLAGLVGYKIINIMYTDYSVRAKLIQRVQYVEGLLKSAVADAT